MLIAAAEAVSDATRDLDFLRLDPAAFERAPKISVDYAVMERTKRAGVLPVAFPWSDIGSWDAIWRVLDRDADGNVRRGETRLVDTRDSLVYGDDRLTAVVGLDNVVVVATPDAVLVTARDVPDATVKELVSRLKEEGRPEADEHRRVHRPWGWYQAVDVGPRFQVKRICVQPGGRLSLQKHFHRAEHWIVVRGTAEVTVDDTVSLIHENEPAYIPIGATHRLFNPGKIPLEIIEVQVGSYTGEDDIIRLEDVITGPASHDGARVRRGRRPSRARGDAPLGGRRRGQGHRLGGGVARPRRPGRGGEVTTRGPGAEQPRGLHPALALFRRHRGPLRQPHRRGALPARRPRPPTVRSTTAATACTGARAASATSPGSSPHGTAPPPPSRSCPPTATRAIPATSRSPASTGSSVRRSGSS